MEQSSSNMDPLTTPLGRKRPRNEAVIVVDTPSPPVATHKPDNKNIEDDDEEEVQICSPPPAKKESNAMETSTANDDDDEELVVLSSKMTNPNIDYPHKRTDCGVYPYTFQTALRRCPKCYCVACDKPAVECQEWSVHCTAKPRPKDTSISTDEVTMISGPEALAMSESVRAFLEAANGTARQLHERGVPYLGEDVMNLYGGRRRPARRLRPDKDKRITEILAEKLQEALHVSDCQTTDASNGIMMDIEENVSQETLLESLKMEGDIPRLRLHNSFFVQGIRIGWPFSTILTPQRQMAIHIIKALQRKLHVVLESPTGTGKSAAILCSVLAWQRHHAQCFQPTPIDDLVEQACENNDDREVGEKIETKTPTIIYCSRTHSQVAQMVASLQKTPYRPRMTVLGSRERLCINEDVNPRTGPKPKRLNVTTACRERKMETDRRRKELLKDITSGYDDDDPKFEETDGNNNHNDENRPEANGTDTNRRRRKKPICTHYQQLSAKRIAKVVQERYRLPSDKLKSCCSQGGEHTKAGAMDIEDLVAFGKNPNQVQTVALYRPNGTGSFGMSLEDRNGGGCQVVAIRQDGPAFHDGTVQIGDRILSVNGQNARQWNVDKTCDFIVALSKDPLRLTIQRKPVSEAQDEDDEDENGISSHAACPYYLSRALIPSANLIFAPYNYVLDPHIRNIFKLDLKGSVVVLDEAHNIEDTLCESGSGEFSEFDLCNLIPLLTRYSNNKQGTDSLVDMVSDGDKIPMSELAHELLLFIEGLVNYLRKQRFQFENGLALEKVKSEHQRFKLPDDHSVEVMYSGPTGFGLKGEATGCKKALAEIGATPETCQRLLERATSLENHLFGDDSISDTILNDLLHLLTCIDFASKAPEHFYMSCNMKPNGNIDFATGMPSGEYDLMMDLQRWRKHPRSLPLTSPRTEAHPGAPLHVCNHAPCSSTNGAGYFVGGPVVRHGEVCNGDRPRWETHLTIRLLSPGFLMKQVASECRSVILASGSLAPLPSLCAELNLYGPKTDQNSNQVSLSQQSQSPANKFHGRLQTLPKPLEANHVVTLPKQLLTCAIGHFPDGSPLTVSYSKYKDPSFFPRFGNALADVIESIPTGGVLVFMPSYGFLKKCTSCWNPDMRQVNSRNNPINPNVWTRLLRSKGKVIVEPTGGQDQFEAARDEYKEEILRNKKCLLLAVFRGKMSEGISFNDDNARAVVCVGIPFPNSFERNIKAKKSYNEEQRKIRKNTNLLPGGEWYSQQAYRAIGQALGRCIRHGADYGTVILMDSRYCDDGSPNNGIPSQHRNLPRWMRHTVRTLSMRPTSGVGNNPICGGYQGLAAQLRAFFAQAPAHSQTVLDKWKKDLEAAQQRSKENEGRVFDRTTGKWLSKEQEASNTESKSKVKPEV